jgi:hypothetical protein
VSKDVMKCLLLKLILGSITFSMGVGAVFICRNSAALTHSSKNTVFIIKPVTSKNTVLYKNNYYCTRGNPLLEKIAMKKLNREFRKQRR